MIPTIEPIKKPSLRKDIRSWISWRLIDLANWVRPKNEAALAYMTNIMMEAELESMMYGRSSIEIKVKKGGGYANKSSNQSENK